MNEITEKLKGFKWSPGNIKCKDLENLYEKLEKVSNEIGFDGSEVSRNENCPGCYVVHICNEDGWLKDSYSIEIPDPDEDGGNLEFRDEKLRPLVRSFFKK